MSNLVSVSDMAVMADSIVKSGFYGFKTKEQVMAVMLVAQAENKHPATVVQEYDIIQGRPALKSQALLARFQLAGGKVEWHEVSAKRCSGTFSHAQGGSLTIEWTIDMAKQAGLVREGSGWTKYPEDMLTSRVISRAVRKVFPGCILGHYSTEEVQDFEPKTKHMGNVIHVETVSGDEVLQPSQTLAYALMIPGAEEAYASYATMEEWLDGFNAMLEKIQKSAKLTEEGKEERIMSLEQCNAGLLAKLTPVEVSV